MVSLNATPTRVAVGDSTVLTWSSTDATSCSATGAWDGVRSTSGSMEVAGLPQGTSTFILSCMGSGGTTARSVSVSAGAAGGGTIAGLNFPSNDDTTGTVRFKFANPLAIYPATYIWRVNPRQQSGYYTTFFWGNDGDFWWDSGTPNTTYGAHPYPNVPPSGSTHRWEIAVNGGDYVDSVSGASTAVSYGRWHVQALRAWSDSAGKHHEFYWDLPDTSKVISRTEPTSYGNKAPPSPALTFGDAPWNPSKELLSGILRGIQIYSTLLSVDDLLAEVTAPLSTSAGTSNVWYLNLDPTPSDISDKSGKGHHPAWVGPERPALWTGP